MSNSKSRTGRSRVRYGMSELARGCEWGGRYRREVGTRYGCEHDEH